MLVWTTGIRRLCRGGVFTLISFRRIRVTINESINIVLWSIYNSQTLSQRWWRFYGIHFFFHTILLWIAYLWYWFIFQRIVHSEIICFVTVRPYRVCVQYYNSLWNYITYCLRKKKKDIFTYHNCLASLTQLAWFENAWHTHNTHSKTLPVVLLYIE